MLIIEHHYMGGGGCPPIAISKLDKKGGKGIGKKTVVSSTENRYFAEFFTVLLLLSICVFHVQEGKTKFSILIV